MQEEIAHLRKYIAHSHIAAQNTFYNLISCQEILTSQLRLVVEW
jgi:hypothetical protein